MGLRRWYGYAMAGYNRPLSRGELRRLKRKRRRTILWYGVGISVILAAVVGLLYVLYLESTRF